MLMTLASLKKSTNVRFIIAISATLGGCVSLPPPLANQRSECGVGLKAVCATFGSERSCECVPRAELDRFLHRFGEPAWLGGPP
jgi:hypothetical protein